MNKQTDETLTISARLRGTPKKLEGASETPNRANPEAKNGYRPRMARARTNYQNLTQT
jgi:hypothetical protein